MQFLPNEQGGPQRPVLETFLRLAQKPMTFSSIFKVFLAAILISTDKSFYKNELMILTIK
jgi:hypothetical protein